MNAVHISHEQSAPEKNTNAPRPQTDVDGPLSVIVKAVCSKLLRALLASLQDSSCADKAKFPRKYLEFSRVPTVQGKHFTRVGQKN